MWCKTAVIEAYATAISKVMQLMESVVVDRVLPISLNRYAVPALPSACPFASQGVAAVVDRSSLSGHFG